MTKQGFTVWLTGLPCAGKSTLAGLLEEKLRQLGHTVQTLDGDEVRKRLSQGLGYTKDDRVEHISRIAYLAKLLNRVGAVCVTAAISPYRESRELARQEIQNFVEVYVQCPLPVCIQRDVKGLYEKALRGELSNFTGISDPYEPPEKPDVIVQTDRESPEESLAKILQTLLTLTYILPGPGKDRARSWGP